MCNACGFSCCAWDGFSECGCEGCEESGCWLICPACGEDGHRVEECPDMFVSGELEDVGENA